MKPTRRFGRAFVLNAFLFWVLAGLARAYLEPGATSFLLKIIISSLVGIVLVFRPVWRSIRLLFSKPDSRKQKQGSED